MPLLEYLLRTQPGIKIATSLDRGKPESQACTKGKWGAISDPEADHYDHSPPRTKEGGASADGDKDIVLGTDKTAKHCVQWATAYQPLSILIDMYIY